MGDIDNQLNYAMSLSDSQRERTDDLDTGYDSATNVWELIVRHEKGIVWPSYVMQVNELYGGYATLSVAQDFIDELAKYPGIYYVEKPKRLYYDRLGSQDTAQSAGSFPLTLGGGFIRNNSDINGKGVILAVIDSGIDYSHLQFRDKDGKSKIIGIWDQTGRYDGGFDDEWLTVTGSLPGPPQGYNNGIYYPNEWIDYVLGKNQLERRRLLPQEDVNGHGTAVTGIASQIAWAADILFVKLGQSQGDSFPRTTRLMEAINWVLDVGVRLERPVALNLSFGNNYGPHDGRSLLETYIDGMSVVGRNSIVIGTGNEGNRNLHYETVLPREFRARTRAQFSISYNQRSLNIQIWKRYLDDVEVSIQLPNGSTNVIMGSSLSSRAQSVPVGNGSIEGYTTRLRFNGMDIYAFVSPPTPYDELEEIYIEFIRGADDIFLQGGVYTIILNSIDIVDGRIDMWMPSGNVVERQTGFLEPSPDTTLTIPSTAANAISVGAIDSKLLIAADYSGRGFLINGLIKPDIAAPGTQILAPSVGGGYSLNTGTSMAAPYITGGAALLMQWGIIEGNDLLMYGQKLKALLQRNANRSDVSPLVFPNTQTGWGVYEG